MLGEVQSMETPLSLASNLEDLTESLCVLLQDVIQCLDEFPNALEMLKQALASLILPLDNGKIASIIEPSLYNDARSVADICSSLSPFISPLNLSLLRLCVSSTKHNLVIAKIVNFNHLRMSNGSFVLCSNKSTVPTAGGLNDLNTNTRSGAEIAHTACLNQLQSVHPSLFAGLGTIPAAVLSEKYMRVSACVSRKSVTLADYECLLTAISGYFILPKCAFTYVGCTEQPLCLCWVVSKQLQGYMRSHGGGVSGECMLSEQGIVNLKVGDWLNYHCLTKNVSSVCLCVCVCERERERQTDRERHREV